METLWGTGTGTGETCGVWLGGKDRRSRSSVRSPLSPPTAALPTAALGVVMEAGRSRL